MVARGIEKGKLPREKVVLFNVQVFMKKGEFGPRQPEAGAGFSSNVEKLSKLHSIPSVGTIFY
jgi:hypothetical protein